MMDRIDTFRRELEKLINKYSMENGSDTPDFILAKYLTDCLQAFDTAISHRGRWFSSTRHSIPPSAIPPSAIPPSAIPPSAIPPSEPITRAIGEGEFEE